MRCRILILLALLLFTAGCQSLFHKSPTCTFPAGMEETCYGARNDARDKIQGRGTKLKIRSSCKVVTVPGERKAGDMWAWRDPAWPEFYVCGLACSGGRLIKIAVNPQTGQDLHIGALTHEFAHYWLMTNYQNNRHDALYDGLFHNWKASRQIIGWSIHGLQHPAGRRALQEAYVELKPGEIMTATGKDDAGEPYHIDFIKLPPEE